MSSARSEEIDFSSIESELNASRAGVKEAEREVKDAKKALKELSDSSKKVDKLQKEEREARETLSRLEALCELLDKRLQEKIEEVEAKAMRIRECEELTRDARNLWTKADTMQKIQELGKKIDRVKDIDKKRHFLGNSQ